MNVTLEWKRSYLKSTDHKRMIKITKEIFYRKYPEINLINMNDMLESLSQGTFGRWY